MTDTGNPLLPERAADAATTGVSVPESLPSRRSLRAQRDADGVASGLLSAPMPAPGSSSAAAPDAVTATPAASVPVTPVEPLHTGSHAIPALNWPAPGGVDERSYRDDAVRATLSSTPAQPSAPAPLSPADHVVHAASEVPTAPVAPQEADIAEAQAVVAASPETAIVVTTDATDAAIPVAETAIERIPFELPVIAQPAPFVATEPQTPVSRRASRTSGDVAVATARPKMKLPAVRLPQKRPGRKGALGVVTMMLVVPGLFLTVALPAYAFSPGSDQAVFKESGAHIISEANAQSVDVSSSAAKITVARDGYVLVSGDEVRKKAKEAEEAAQAQAAAERRARAGGYSTPGQRAEGDDYPWAFNSQGVLSPLGYYYRECVDFVAWRLNRDAGFTGPWKYVWAGMTPGGGSAWNWANAWESHGWAISHDPIVGSVAWFTYNHVAYVQSVNGDGTVTIEEYNQQGDHNYHRRTLAISDVALFLYPPPA